MLHVATPDPDQTAVHVGLELVSPDPVTINTLSEYIWKRLRDLYPGSLPELRDQMDSAEGSSTHARDARFSTRSTPPPI